VLRLIEIVLVFAVVVLQKIRVVFVEAKGTLAR
jgi:hypothetical protein